MIRIALYSKSVSFCDQFFRAGNKPLYLLWFLMDSVQLEERFFALRNGVLFLVRDFLLFPVTLLSMAAVKSLYSKSSSTDFMSVFLSNQNPRVYLRTKVNTFQ